MITYKRLHGDIMGANLVTLQEVKSYKGINSTNQDAIINTIIPKVSQLVKTICKRSFIDYVDDAKVEYHRGGALILPQEHPLLEISSLEYSSDYGKTYVTLKEFVDYVVDYDTSDIRPTLTFPEGVNAYKLTYKAGYEEIPQDLKLAVLDLVDYYMKNDAAVHSPKAPGTNSVQIEYISSNKLPAHIKRVLDQYISHYA